MTGVAEEASRPPSEKSWWTWCTDKYALCQTGTMCSSCVGCLFKCSVHFPCRRSTRGSPDLRTHVLHHLLFTDRPHHPRSCRSAEASYPFGRDSSSTCEHRYRPVQQHPRLTTPPICLSPCILQSLLTVISLLTRDQSYWSRSAKGSANNHDLTQGYPAGARTEGNH